MKVLYKEKDLWYVIEDYILPCLNEAICDLEKHFKRGDMDTLRCVDKTLNKRIVERSSENCEYITIEGKRRCSKHCKALPFYIHLKKRIDQHDRSTDQFIHFHFNKPLSYAIANMFKDQYKDRIKLNRFGRLKGCCEKNSYDPRWPQGWHLKIDQEKRDRIIKEYEEFKKASWRWGGGLNV